MAGLNKVTVDDISVKGKKVLVRVDFNVPLKDGVITNDNRIQAALPTIKKLIADGGKVVLCSHLGKPKNGPEDKFSLKPAADRLAELVDTKVVFAKDDTVVGENAKKAVAAGNDDEARQFLTKKNELTEKVDALQKQYDICAANAVKMREMHDKLEEDIKTLKGKRDTLKTKVKVAETQKKMSQLGSGLESAGNNMAAFEKMEEKVNKMLDEADAMDELNEKTDTGRISLAVEEYYRHVQQELEEEGEFNPVEAARLTSRGSGIGMFVGYSLRAPIRGEFSPTHGITWGWDFPIRKSMIGLSASIEGFGHSNVYLDTKEGPIHQNERVSSGSAELYYGYNALRTSALSLNPFAGVGVSFYDGETYDDGSGRKTSNEANGFTVEAGLIADAILSSNVRIFAGGRSASQYVSLRFRPYVSLANMRGIGWMPSLNLSVSFNFLVQ